MRYVLRSIVMLVFGFLGAGCAHLADDKTSDPRGTNLNSILWVQGSSEFKANATQIYNMATGNLEAAIADSTGTAMLKQTGNYTSLPPAIIMDIDETVLDNSKYHAQCMMDGSEYSPETWDYWIALKQAKAVPGSAGFINYAESRGVEVILITNRECKKRWDTVDRCPQEEDTIENLKQIGIRSVQAADVLMKNEQEGWSSEKEGRRMVVAEKYRVIMLFGDDLSDFLPQVQKNITPEQRATLVDRHSKKWGVAWYILPNPKYGSWLRVLDPPADRSLKGYSGTRSSTETGS